MIEKEKKEEEKKMALFSSPIIETLEKTGYKLTNLQPMETVVISTGTNLEMP